ncbi:hypothetical protein [Ruegeria sp. HKCCA6837]|uniref:hypothetical protein n=1 Tax=Ruegeria sp. HKCCA6837 TaxID=2682989 RepID=UPI0014891DBE|nr:hypothetical protein [Ruegeria sp. HKCCA6837]
MLNKIGILCSYIVLSAFSLNPHSAFAWGYKERNSITAGDNSINAIALEQSEIIIAIDSDGNFNRYRSEDVANYVKSNNPDLYHEAETEFPKQSDAFIEAIAIAQFFFDSGQYSSSALMFERALGMIDANEGGVRKLEGLTTASYYGSARHIEGLKFICRQYRNRPRWNFEFRHAIHAHLRSLAVNTDHEYAKEALAHVRKNPACRRDDFSPVWIPIHLRDMRWLEDSTPPRDAGYGISKQEDLDFAKSLLANENHGFIDYLYFILGDYTKIIEDYPNSYVIDLALLGQGEAEDYSTAKEALLEYMDRFPKKGLPAVSLLFERATIERDLATLNALVQEYGDRLFSAPSSGSVKFQINNHTRVWFSEGEVKDLSLNTISFFSDFYSRCPRLEQMIYGGDFAEVLEFSNFFIENFENHFDEEKRINGYFGNPGDDEYYDTCLVELNPSKLRDLIRFIEPIAEAYAGVDAEQLAELGKNLKLCGDFREGMNHATDEEGMRQYCENMVEWINELNLWRISFHEISALMLRRAYDLDPVRQEKSLFLAGLAHRNNENYEDFYKTMQEFADFYPESNLADDAITEMGWFHLAVRDDPASADAHFRKVVTEYRESNAYDNALNWLIVSKIAQGQYASASKYSTQLVAEVTSNRLSEKVTSRHADILEIVSAIDVNSKIKLARTASSDGNFFGVENRVLVSEVADDSHVLGAGDVIYSIDGNYISDAAEAYRILLNLKQQGKELVSIDFLSKKLDEFRSGELVKIVDFGL